MPTLYSIFGNCQYYLKQRRLGNRFIFICDHLLLLPRSFFIISRPGKVDLGELDGIQDCFGFRRSSRPFLYGRESHVWWNQTKSKVIVFFRRNSCSFQFGRKRPVWWNSTKLKIAMVFRRNLCSFQGWFSRLLSVRQEFWWIEGWADSAYFAWIRRK